LNEAGGDERTTAQPTGKTGQVQIEAITKEPEAAPKRPRPSKVTVHATLNDL
jgi:hypothetical protein